MPKETNSKLTQLDLTTKVLFYIYISSKTKLPGRTRHTPEQRTIIFDRPVNLYLRRRHPVFIIVVTRGCPAVKRVKRHSNVIQPEGHGNAI